MVLRSRREYLEAIRPRYHQADKFTKALILDEFCATCGYNRKYAGCSRSYRPRLELNRESNLGQRVYTATK